MAKFNTVNDLHLALDRYLKNHKTLWSQYILSSNIQEMYGFATTSSYVIFIISVLIEAKFVSGRDLCIPDRLIAAMPIEDSDLGLIKLIIAQNTNIPKLLDDEIPCDMDRNIDYIIKKHFGYLACIRRENDVHQNASLEKTLSFVEVQTNQEKKEYIYNGNVKTGVCIIGFPRSVLGLGEDARCLCDVLLNLGCRVEMIDCSPPQLEKISEHQKYESYITRSMTATIVVYCLPLIEIARLWRQDKLKASSGIHYRIAYSPWELSKLPQGSSTLLECFNEIWCSSAFQCQVYSTETSVPIHLVPLYIKEKSPEYLSDIADSLGDKFNFGFAFDFSSKIERKNPLGLVQAFKAAFRDKTEPVQLVLKTINSHSNREASARVLDAAAGDDRIIFVDGPISDAHMSYFLQQIDVFVSLHRSEGFGRIIAEAMSLNTLVVATGWSGSDDFVSHNTAIVIPYELRDVCKGEYPHAIGMWAEPDIPHAAEAMSNAYYNFETYKGLGENGREHVKNKFSLSQIARVLQQRFIDITAVHGQLG